MVAIDLFWEGDLKTVFDKAHRVFCDCMNDGNCVLPSIQYLKLAYWEVDTDEQKQNISEMISKINEEYFYKPRD